MDDIISLALQFRRRSSAFIKDTLFSNVSLEHSRANKSERESHFAPSLFALTSDYSGRFRGNGLDSQEPPDSQEPLFAVGLSQAS